MMVMHVKTARVGLLGARSHLIDVVLGDTCRFWLDEGQGHLRCGAAWVLASGGSCGFKPLLELGDGWRGNFICGWSDLWLHLEFIKRLLDE